MKKISALMVILFLSGSVYAADCSTVEEMDAADTVASSITNWTDVNSFFHKFKQCDDGYIAEGLSATITRMLADNWNTSTQLETMSDKDKAFGSWVRNHINTTVDSKDLESTIYNAREKCADSSKAFCSEIESAANQALQELKE
jgi:hypothetical protein